MQKDLSKLLGHCWATESQSTKQYYARLAKERKIQHDLEHPGSHAVSNSQYRVLMCFSQVGGTRLKERPRVPVMRLRRKNERLARRSHLNRRPSSPALQYFPILMRYLHLRVYMMVRFKLSHISLPDLCMICSPPSILQRFDCNFACIRCTVPSLRPLDAVLPGERDPRRHDGNYASSIVQLHASSSEYGRVQS